MEAIYNRDGVTVGWRYRDNIVDLAGRPIAFVRGRTVYTFDGTCRGRFEDGFFRDDAGDAVAFTKGATGGPMPPKVAVSPVQPKLVDLPVPPETGAPPAPPRIRSREWSGLSWPDFLGLGAKPAARHGR